MTKIKLTANGIVIPGTLNDTVAAKDFATRLPMTVHGNDSGIDYCCVASEGKCDDRERQDGWTNGDINLAQGWFALLYGGEEQSKQYKNQMIIGRMDDGYMDLLEKVPSQVDFLIELA